MLITSGTAKRNPGLNKWIKIRRIHKSNLEDRNYMRRNGKSK